MADFSEEQLQALIIAFEARTLPKSMWTHEAHLAVACWYIWHYPFNEAVERIRLAIKKYNEAVGTPNTEISGYHETITCFWMQVLVNYKSKYSDLDLVPLCNAFLVSKYAQKELPLTCLPIERLLSPKARLELDTSIFECAWKALF